MIISWTRVWVIRDRIIILGKMPRRGGRPPKDIRFNNRNLFLSLFEVRLFKLLIELKLLNKKIITTEQEIRE